MEWSQDVPVEGSIDLPPDPRAFEAIGRNHSFETALSDLVDNSIDAGATHVLISLVKLRGALRSVYVVDNGRGMTPDKIDSAMTVGGRRDYGDGDLGHFGLGLKAASFSQARTLTVMSQAAGHASVGRRWRLDKLTGSSFTCDIVPSEFVDAEFNREWGIPMISGTTVRWDDVVSFPASDDRARVETFLNTTITNACQHLGMVFHRFLQDARLNIEIEVRDVDTDFVAPPIPVTPLDPFGYPTSARPDYPKNLVAVSGDTKLTFRCHLWPAPSSSAQYQLSGDPIQRQGLYFYRRGRLLQAGGWVGVHAIHRRLRLARVEVEVDNDVTGLFQMNAEKSRVQVGPEFAGLASSAQAEDGTTLADYLTIAEDVFTASQQRERKRAPVIYPGAGLPPHVRKTIKNELTGLSDEPIDIRWDTFVDDSFFRVDRDTQTLWLNNRYRKMLLGGKNSGLNDLPLLKSLIYLLVENVFRGSHLGPRDKDNIELWQTILTAAVQAERR
ncbi:ATP-binding protein [Actinokineospora sp. G85]|uniref:ATP-binding protein n=1 Tax=Actinokineospora sp. G85 TaxID=3406626 RepID=UPI003C770FD7